MPLSIEDLHKIRTSFYEILQDEIVIKKLRTGILNLDSLKNIQGTVLPILTTQSGQIAGLQESVKQLSKATGATVDLAAVEAAAKKGAEAALAEGVKIDLTVGGAK